MERRQPASDRKRRALIIGARLFNVSLQKGNRVNKFKKAPTVTAKNPLPAADRKAEGTFCFIVDEREAQSHGSNYTGFPAVNHSFLQSGLSLS
jgi:hypothetical protein